MVREFIPGVLTWPWFWSATATTSTAPSCCTRNLCIDPVHPDEAALDRLVKEGVAWILITNRNHVRAANTVRERTGAATAIHPADADHAREQGAEIDAELEVGQSVGPFRIVDASGKSPGEIGLHDPERRLLIVGDAVIGNPPGRLSLLSERVMDDPARLKASLRRLLELDFDAVLVGDGAPIRGGGRERLRELVAEMPHE
jgi:glyoxylase-like metal-dependent hydrolase (beta-lactamase superfamily II)